MSTGWDDDNFLRRIAGENRGVGVGSDLDESTQFQLNVTRLITRRIAATSREEGTALFLFAPEPPADLLNECRMHPILNNGRTSIPGHIWFVSHVAASGRSYAFPSDWDDVDAFDFVTQTLGLGNVPAMHFDGRLEIPEARFYSTGLADPDAVSLMRLGGAELDIVTILGKIDDIWRSCLATPTVHSPSLNLWRNKAKYRPADKIEDRIQAQLRPGLVTAFNCDVRAEQTGTTGRLDIILEEVDWSDASKVIVHAVLELKVLRSFWSTPDSSAVSDADNQKWISDGVDQALSYGLERHARAKALCCFDMRKTPDAACLKGVEKKASVLGVDLGWWPIFTTAKDIRRLVSESILAERT